MYASLRSIGTHLTGAFNNSIAAAVISRSIDRSSLFSGPPSGAADADGLLFAVVR